MNAGIATVAFCYFSQSLTSVRPSTIALFVYSSLSHQLANTLSHTHTHTFIHSHTLTRTHSHLPEPRTRTDKREKLTPYARFQSVCRPLLREASNRMKIAVRLFACYLYSLFLSSIPFVRLFVRSSVHRVQETDEIHALLFSMYACMRVHACIDSLTSE